MTEELTPARRSRRRDTCGRRFAVAFLALTLATGLAVGVSACGDDDDEPQPAGSNSGSDAAFSEYIGLETEAAGDLAEENDLPWRVVREDGEDLPVTMDFVENRLNFAVEDGKVVDVTTG